MEWLKGYWKLEEEISLVEWNLRRAISSEENEQSIKEIESRLEEKVKLRQDLIDVINIFKGFDNQILKLRYIDGLTLVQVAEKLGYSYNYTRSKHAKIMRTLRFANSIKKGANNNEYITRN